MSGKREWGASLLVAMLAVVTWTSGLRAQEERGWIGININCNACVQERSGDTAVWQFMVPPRIEWVRDGSPAEEGGLKAGDVILAIGDVAITTKEGGRLFGSMQVGVPVGFRVRRGDGELDVRVTPAAYESAFGKLASKVSPRLDSVQVQLRHLREGQLRMRAALVQAERALVRTEAELRAEPSAERRQEAEELRVQIDSMNRSLMSSYHRVRVYADSLAAWTLYVSPDGEAAPRAVNVSGGVPGTWTVLVYGNAVAGARFEELEAGSPLVSGMEGVDGGLLIVKVVEETPAYEAGLRQGDVVIEVNGTPVRTVAELRRLLGSGRAELTYVRMGKKRTCRIGSN